MAPLSLKIIVDEGAITRTLMFDTTTTVQQADHIVKEKILTLDQDKEYGFFLTSADNECSGVWLEDHRTLEYYMLREGDSLYYLEKVRNLRVRMLDGSVKTMQVDESKNIGDLMVLICEKIGITNHDEYGLCREDQVEDEMKPMTGTLTLKKKSQIREKDAKLEQLRKKLKTDDNVQWLDQHKTLRELHVDPKETLLFKRRLFYSDRNVDSRDPVQLNLLYVQTRDAILDGRQVVTEDRAVEFAGIQCQIQYEDFNEDKHKPGFIENLKEFLPVQYSTSWGIEKRIFKEHKKHHGLSPLEAKNLYTKTARELPTYGVTFFLVKEKQKGKKKLVPRLLGINSESILRLDEGTKEILQVWPLTQVKSYRAGSESFTLDFGDYSEKEYAVKTNDAMRIRDILQGYIDIIKKRLAAPYNVTYTQGEAMCEDNVEISRGTIIQNVVPNKVVEQSFVGPSRIISVEQGRNASGGTKIVTVHEMVTTTRTTNSQQAFKGEILSETPQTFGKRLNRMNSFSVKTVVLLSDPSKENIDDVHRIACNMESELPTLVKGVRETARNLDADKSKKLLDELDELCDYINNFSSLVNDPNCGSPEKVSAAKDYAMKIADISAQMYLALDPKTKGRAQLIKSSRNSFIADEKTEAHLRRLSYRTAAEMAHEAVDKAYTELDTQHRGHVPDAVIVENLEKALFNRIGKLNAAVALLLNAHSDPNNVDYSTAVTCMTTIKELIPEIILDVKTLNSGENDDARLALSDEIKKLLDRTAALCRLTGTDDTQKIQDAGKAYGDVARKLVFTFNRGEKRRYAIDKENEIIDLAKEVGDKTSHLLMDVKELNGLASEDPRSQEVDTAGAKCSDAARELVVCAELTAPSIHEPHCQSALTAACENLSSSAQHLTNTYKPIIDDPGRHYYGKKLHNRAMELMKALERLQDAYSNLDNNKINPDGDIDEIDQESQNQKLKFIATLSGAKKALQEAEQRLEDVKSNDTNAPLSEAGVNQLRKQLSQKIAQLNAAIASLTKSVSENPDYKTTEAAISTLSQLTPEIMRDAKILEAHMNDGTQQEMSQNLRAMLEATKNICTSAENNNNQDLNEATMEFAKASGKLYYVFNPRADSRVENEIIDLAKDVGEKASYLLMDVNELNGAIADNPRSDDLDAAGVQCSDAASGLVSCAELVAPTIRDARCQSALTTACENLASTADQLAHSYKSIVDEPGRQDYRSKLHDRLMDLTKALERLQDAYSNLHENNEINQDDEGNDNKPEKLKFIASLSGAKRALQDAEKQLQDGNRDEFAGDNIKTKADAQRIRKSLADKIARLNAAIASLSEAVSDNPDYKATEAAISTLTQLTPEILRDARMLENHLDDETQQGMIQDLKVMLEEAKNICASAENNDSQDLNEATMAYAKSSGKLYYIFNPRRDTRKENEILDLAKDVGEKASYLLMDVNELNGAIAGDPRSEDLDVAGVKCSDAASRLVSCAELIAPTIRDARCQNALSAACENLASSAHQLASTYKPIADEPGRHDYRNKLNDKFEDLLKSLEKLEEAYRSLYDDNDGIDANESDMIKTQKQKLNASLSSAKEALQDAEKQLQDVNRDKFVKDVRNTNTEADVQRLRNSLSQKIAQLNAAIASLSRSVSDNPDYQTTDSAIGTLSQITPEIIRDARILESYLSDGTEKEMLENLKAMVEATKNICASAENNSSKDLHEATMEFAKSSGKLYYVCNPRANNSRKEKEITKLAKDVGDKTTVLLQEAKQLIKVLPDERQAKRVEDASDKCADAAKQLIASTEITAPTIHEARCQDTLTTACEKVASVVQDLAIAYKPLVDHPSRQQFGKRLVVKSMDLIHALDKLKDAYSNGKFEDDIQTSDEKHKQKQQFKDNLSSAIQALLDAEQQLQSSANFGDKTSSKIKNDDDAKDLRLSLSEKLAQLNAAIASLLRATNDDIDYDSANAAINTITRLTPDLIKDAKYLESHLDDKDQDKISENIRGMLEASKGLVLCAEDNNFKQLKEVAYDFANSSGKLYYVINPRANPRRENQILDLSRGACEDTSKLLIKVYDLAKNVGGEDGAKLDDAGTKIVDSAQTFLTAALMTAPTMYDPECQTTMISFTDKFSNLVKDLEDLWTPLVEDKPDIKDNLSREKDVVQASLERLKAACLDNSMNEINAEKEQLLSTVAEAKDRIKQAQFLCTKERLRELPPPHVHEFYATTVSSGCSKQTSIMPTKMRLFDKLSHMNESTALLVQAVSDDDSKDYKTTEDIVKNISHLVPDIIQDALSMHEYLADSTLQGVIAEAKSLCEASHDICSNIEAKDVEGLNKAASKYANSSGKLFCLFSHKPDVDKENQILNLARSACERASLMLSRVSRLAQAVPSAEAEQLDKAGVKLADAAQVLLTNAQITASSIEDTRCQSALNSSIDRVSRIAHDLGSIWNPLIQEPHQQLGEQLNKDLQQLQAELENLKGTCQCIATKTPRQSWAQEEIVEMNDPKILEKTSTKKMPEADTQIVEEIIIEETPLRESASEILNSIVHDINQGNLTPDESKTRVALKNKLEAAIKALDEANARCRRDPNDSKKREELENVILNLQHACLQSRRNGQESNIVDLMDYVSDVTSAADEIMTATISINPDHGKKALIDIRDECERIKYNAEELSNPQDIHTDDSVIDTMMLIEKFAADCDNGVHAIEEAINNFHDDNSKKMLSDKHRQLNNTCNLLRFATKGSISSAAAANYEENLQNLLDTEEKIRDFLDAQKESEEQEQPNEDLKKARKEAAKDAQIALFKTVVAGKDNNLPQVLTQYAVKLEASTPKDSSSRRKLSEHLNNLSNLLKKLSHTRSRQIATWQEGDNDDVINISKEIEQELNSFDLGVGQTKPGLQTLHEINLDNLFQPKKIFVSGDDKEMQAKFDQQTQKLNTLIGAVVECSQKPENLARNVHSAATSASEVASIAKSMKNKDVIQESKIEEAIKELKSSTYHLLKTSESTQNAAGRRKLLDACRALSETVNKLARSVSPLHKWQRDCSELQRNLQLQQSFVSTDLPACALSFADCVDALVTQQDVIQKLQSEDLMSRSDCITTLRYVSTAACSSAELAAHSAYLVSISEDDNEVAKKGLVDTDRLTNLTENIEEVVSKMMYTNDIGLMKNLNTALSTHVQQYLEVVEDCCNKVNKEDSNKIKALSKEVTPATSELQRSIYSTPFEGKDVLVNSARVVERVQRVNFTINRLPLPKRDDSPSKRQDVKEIVDNARNLLSNTSDLVKQVSSSEEEVMTWVMYGRDNVIKAYEALLNCVREKGMKAKLLQSEATKEELDAPPKSNLQKQIELTNKWLQNPGCKPDVKAAAIKAAQHVIEMGDKMWEDLKDPEKEEMLQVVTETKQLLKDCSQTYNSEKASLLLERLRDLRKMLERGVVTRVVEDFLEEQPLEDIEAIHKEKDAKKREFLLDKKIAELLAQLGRIKRTATFVSDTSAAPVRQELLTVSDQVELLAPSLVKAVQETVRKPNDEEAIDNYKKLILQYAESLSRVRELCDRAVDPMDFAQAAGETMARIKENSQNDPQKSLHTTRIITKLGNRVVEAGMSSPNVQKDPELQKTLADIKKSISAAASARADLTTEIIRKTGEIESALGGETIFQKEPEPDQPIFAAAHGLHAAVRDWSARDNEVVAVAKRVAVLMAQLSHHMYNDRKRELIATSKAIVAKSHEVTQLARKLALQCTDLRIRNNLLQLCERIITISGQLKMLTTVKGSSLGHQGSEEDKEAMNMLVGNAQNLMISIREVVNGAESASVKIMSQRGRRIKWVRRNYY
ncbi:talin-1-like isoform X2 [Zerene cesonia]|uniref:talin-1-like isoform X2 n=1 Tax=Zerene cesonia TaxID=33412 RepID=UPI0018E58BFB|nr:talin-1-like isoform X2 [Zerene cesonia]